MQWTASSFGYTATAIQAVLPFSPSAIYRIDTAADVRYDGSIPSRYPFTRITLSALFERAWNSIGILVRPTPSPFFRLYNVLGDPEPASPLAVPRNNDDLNKEHFLDTVSAVYHTMPHPDALEFPKDDRFFLEPYLPVHASFQQFIPEDDSPYPWTTLTFATSLDSAIALSPGTRTALSGSESKAMTHYLRARHDGILVGIGTVLADDPGLNCRLLGVGGYGGIKSNRQPRPVIVDPHGKFLDVAAASKVVQLARDGKGLGAWVVMSWTNDSEILGRVRKIDAVLEEVGGKVVMIKKDHPRSDGRINWMDLLHKLKREGLDSVMIEGGGTVINDLLRAEHQHLISSVMVTIAPTWLGQGGVVVSPERQVSDGGTSLPVARLKTPKWYPLGEDVVLAGRLQ